MRRPAKKAPKKRSSAFLPAFKSFVGHLEGTGKAAHTIRNYRLDLEHFQTFLLSTHAALRTPDLTAVTPAQVDAYHGHLKAQGLRANTRRRKILTIGKFLRYIAGRNPAVADLGRKYAAPHKIERVPEVVSRDDLLAAVRALPAASVLEARNRALLWTLVETGMLVHEVAALRFDSFNDTTVTAGGRESRKIPISHALSQVIQDLRRSPRAGNAVFTGFNRYGSLGTAISPRGVELLVRAFAPRLGFVSLTPRMIRHSVAVQWIREGQPRTNVRERLGLKTDYAFRVYEPLLAGKPPVSGS